MEARKARLSGERPSGGRLIDQVTNQWRGEKSPSSEVLEVDDHGLRFCDLEEEDSCPNVTQDLLRSRRARKYALSLLLVFSLMFYLYSRYIGPHLQDEWDLKAGFLTSRTNGTYGIARGGDFDGTSILQMKRPYGDSDFGATFDRLVFVGDIHGCKDELLMLLEKLAFDPVKDHLIATGDVISKGPDGVGVLDELMKIKATSVRGNHEDRILEMAKTVLDSDMPPQSAEATSKGHAKDAALLKQLKSKHLKYLRGMPLMVHIPAFSRNGAYSRRKEMIYDDILVVHAGLVPHVPLENQDPQAVMNMRSIDDRTHVPSALPSMKSSKKSRPWTKLWNWYNDRIARGKSIKGFHHYHAAGASQHQIDYQKYQPWHSTVGDHSHHPKPAVVVYGHDSKAGLQLHQWSKGLDTACVAGGQLTAMTLDMFDRTEIVQVDCKDYKSG